MLIGPCMRTSILVLERALTAAQSRAAGHVAQVAGLRAHCWALKRRSRAATHPRHVSAGRQVRRVKLGNAGRVEELQCR